tara:strand:+ start:2806 stop:3744 length:939 start_codon:yes stop_codon:yes gene_type:complete
MRHLFIIDPLENIRPEKDSSSALMQAAERLSIEVWVCTPPDLEARGDQVWISATKVLVNPWLKVVERTSLSYEHFDCIWMRKDPPVNEAYLYATHLLEVAERQGVKVINKPSSLRAWNEKLGALRFSHLMAPTFVGSRVADLSNFAKSQKEVVIKPLGGKGGQGVIRANEAAIGLDALLELVTSQETLPVMMQKFIPQVLDGDKRILLINGKPMGAINRIPKEGDFRSNLALGGKPVKTYLSDKELEICSELEPHLKKDKLFFVGIDVIGGMLSEINVTSPTGIREVELLSNKKLSDQIIESLLSSEDLSSS